MTTRARPLKRYCEGPPEYGLNIPAGDYSDEGVRFLRTTDIGAQGGLASDEGVFVPNDLALEPRHQLLPGDLLFSRSGSLGRCLRFQEQYGPATFAGYLVRFRPGHDADARFLEYCAQSKPFQAAIEADAITSTISNFNAERYAAINLPDVPLPEQRAIADYLDAETARIDALIAKKHQLIHLLEERWIVLRNASILQRVDPVSGRGVLPEGWTCPQLGVLVELQRGHDLPAEARREGPFPVVSSGGISGHHDEWACRAPAVVTGRYGTVGEVFYVEEDCWPLNTTLYVRDFRGNDPRWVAFALESLPLDAESEKSAVGGINRNVIGKLRVPCPGLEEQGQIAAELAQARDTHDMTRHALERQLGLLAEHRQAMITAAVTGEFTAPRGC